MSVYVLLRKKREHQTSLPYYEIHNQVPELSGRDKLVVLEPDECIDVAKFSFSQDLTFIQVMEYCVSNIGGKAKEEFVESYTLPRYV